MPKFQPIPSFDSLSPQTTKGDLISRSTTTAVRVAVGSDGQVIIADSTQASGIKWGAPTAGSLSVVAKTSAYPITSSDDIITVSGGVFSTTLPDVTVSANRKLYRVVKTDTSLTNIVTIDTTSSQNIEYNGTTQTSVPLNTVDEEWEIGPNAAGTAWRVLNHKTAMGPTSAGAIQISATSAYTFTIPSSSVTAGAVYSTPNGSVFTVSTTIAGSTTLTCAGTAAPNAASNTLTKTSGVGPATLAYSATTSTGQPSFGTPTLNDVSFTRNGRWVTLVYSLAVGGSPVTGSGDYVIYMPSGLSADLTNLTPYLGANIGTLGETASLTAFLPISGGLLNGNSSGVIGFTVQPYLYSATQLRVYEQGSINTGVVNSGVWGSGKFGLNAFANLTIKFYVTYQVSGWQP